MEKTFHITGNQQKPISIIPYGTKTSPTKKGMEIRETHPKRIKGNTESRRLLWPIFRSHLRTEVPRRSNRRYGSCNRRNNFPIPKSNCTRNNGKHKNRKKMHNSKHSLEIQHHSSFINKRSVNVKRSKSYPLLGQTMQRSHRYYHRYFGNSGLSIL